MSDLAVDVRDREGTVVGRVNLPGDVFNVQANIPLMHQVVVAQQAAEAKEKSSL